MIYTPNCVSYTLTFINCCSVYEKFAEMQMLIIVHIILQCTLIVNYAVVYFFKKMTMMFSVWFIRIDVYYFKEKKSFSCVNKKIV